MRVGGREGKEADGGWGGAQFFVSAGLKTLKRPKRTEAELALELGVDETMKGLGKIIKF